MDDLKFRLFDSRIFNADSDALQSILNSGMLASGSYVNKFEKGLSDLTGLSILSTVDVSMSMRIALHLSGVDSDSEVILSPYNCLSSTSAIANLGAQVVWANMDGIFLDINDVRSKITHKTKAIICYHIAGYVYGGLDDLRILCDEFGISLIEDCNSALGSYYADGRHVGSIGDYAVFSFYASRQLNAGEGGGIFVRDNNEAVRAKQLRKFGLDLAMFKDEYGEFHKAYDVPEIGYSSVMSNINCYLGSESLKVLDRGIARRQENAEFLYYACQSFDFITPIEFDFCRTNNWVFLLYTPYKTDLIKFLKNAGVGANSLHQRNDQYSGFKALESLECPSLALIENQMIALPVGDWISRKDCIEIIEVISRFEKNYL